MLSNIAPGMEIAGAKGETLRGFSPNVPNAEFFPHVKLILTLIGINLGVPLVLLLKDASETNFSGWKGAMDQARQGFMRNRRWFRQGFYEPWYRFQVKRLMAEDGVLRRRLEAQGPRMFEHAWRFPGWRSIQPVDDARSFLIANA